MNCKQLRPVEECICNCTYHSLVLRQTNPATITRPKPQSRQQHPVGKRIATHASPAFNFCRWCSDAPWCITSKTRRIRRSKWIAGNLKNSFRKRQTCSFPADSASCQFSPQIMPIIYYSFEARNSLLDLGSQHRSMRRQMRF